MRILLFAVAVLALGGCSQRRTTAAVPATMQPAMRRQVLNAIDAGEGNPRIRALRERVAGQPDNVRVRLELAEAYRLLGFSELELEHLRLAAERFPESEAAIAALARALLRSGRPIEAARKLTVFLDRSKNPSANVLSWAGIALDGTVQWTQGEALHRRALERAPLRDVLHNNLGYNLLMQGRKDEAAGSFRRALALNPGSGTARNNLGMAIAEKPEDALSQFQQAADAGVAHNNLAAYLYEKGDVAGARRELEIAVEYRRDLPQIVENLRKVAAVDGKPIIVPPAGQQSLWKLFARGFKHAFTGEQKPPEIEE